MPQKKSSRIDQSWGQSSKTYCGFGESWPPNRLGCFFVADSATARIRALRPNQTAEKISPYQRPGRIAGEKKNKNHVTVPAGSSAGRTQLQPPFYSFSLGRAPSGRRRVLWGEGRKKTPTTRSQRKEVDGRGILFLSLSSLARSLKHLDFIVGRVPTNGWATVGKWRRLRLSFCTSPPPNNYHHHLRPPSLLFICPSSHLPLACAHTHTQN